VTVEVDGGPGGQAVAVAVARGDVPAPPDEQRQVACVAETLVEADRSGDTVQLLRGLGFLAALVGR
jgi:hypothetical protein